MPHWQDFVVIAFNTLVFWLGFELPRRRNNRSPK